MAVDIEVIAEKLCERQQDVIFLGDGVPVFKDKIVQWPDGQAT